MKVQVVGVHFNAIISKFSQALIKKTKYLLIVQMRFILSLGPYNDVCGTIFDPTVMQKTVSKTFVL